MRTYGRRRGRSYTRRQCRARLDRESVLLPPPEPPSLSFLGCIRAALSLFWRAFK